MSNPERPLSRQMVDAGDLLRVAEAAARAAGEVAIAGFRGDLQISTKGHKDIVTQYDVAAEKAAIASVKQHFPQHGFLAEESGAGHPDGGAPKYRWAIDPIDGTHNYAMQLPYWCCSVAAIDTETGEVRAGAVFDPLHGEMFLAEAGGAATLNGAPIQVSNIERLDEATAVYDLGYEPDLAAQMLEITLRLHPQVRRVRMLGSAVLSMIYVAAGRFDGYYQNNLQSWDKAAASLIVQRAGGLFTDWQGSPTTAEQGGAVLANPVLHPLLLAALTDG